MREIGLILAMAGFFMVGFNLGWKLRDIQAQDQMEQIRKWWRK